MTKEQLLQQVGELISKYEDDTGEIVGAFIQPISTDRTEVHQWDGEKFSEGKCSISLEAVEGTAEFDKAAEQRIKNDLVRLLVG